MIVQDGFMGVKIEKSDSMMRNAWMAYDASGIVYACGVGKLQFESAEGIARKIVVGADLYSKIEEAFGKK